MIFSQACNSSLSFSPSPKLNAFRPLAAPVAGNALNADEGDVAVLDAHAVEVAVRASHELAVYAVDLAHALGRIDDEVVHAVHDVAPLPGSGGLHNPLACWLARDFGEEGRLSVMRKAGAASLLKRRVLTRLSVGRTVAFRQDRCGGAGEGGSGGGERRGGVPVPSGTGRA